MYLHLVEHALLVEVEVARGLPQVQPCHVGAVDQIISLLQVLVLPVCLYYMAHNGALGVPEHQPRPSRLPQAEKVQLLTYPSVVSAGSLACLTSRKDEQ